jgi:hypothetical protein
MVQRVTAVEQNTTAAVGEHHPTEGRERQPPAGAEYSGHRRNPAEWATSISNNQAVSRRWTEVFNERDDAAEADVRAPGYVALLPRVWSLPR